MMKLSSVDATKIAGVLKLSADEMRKLAAERDALREENETLRTERRIDGIKQKMAEKGSSNPFGTEEELDGALRKKASDGTLDVFEQAVKMSAHLSISSLGEVLDGTEKKAEFKPSTQSKSELDAFVLGD